MIPDPITLKIPLKMDADGTYRVSNTRVTLDTIIGCYRQGYTPEKIHENFDVIPVDDAYAVIAYYLANRNELDDYLTKREKDALEIRKKLEAIKTPEQRAFDERVRQLAEAKQREKGK